MKVLQKNLKKISELLSGQRFYRGDSEYVFLNGELLERSKDGSDMGGWHLSISKINDFRYIEITPLPLYDKETYEQAKAAIALGFETVMRRLDNGGLYLGKDHKHIEIPNSTAFTEIIPGNLIALKYIVRDYEKTCTP